MNQHSMAHDGFFGKYGKHRRCSIEKVDNGFVVKARMPVVVERRKTYTQDEKELVYEVVDREYVYYTAEEVVEFLRGYLDKDFKSEEIDHA